MIMAKLASRISLTPNSNLNPKIFKRGYSIVLLKKSYKMEVKQQESREIFHLFIVILIFL